ncbi:MAG: hypothetical protein H6538_08520 [Bacteroidales bacterium]|nr:hypothetical protein [Bacteroidales bacterium]MCB8999172.1 hypothetical protein [Bacteroidales bacterium]
MEKEKFHSYLYKQDSYRKADLAELEELCSKYPWFSSASILMLASSKFQNDPDFALKLKKYSPLIPNRKNLQRILHTGIIAEHDDQEIVKEVEQSRIPGIFDSSEFTVSETEDSTPSSSVLADESLLDFSYSASPVNTIIENAEGIKAQEIDDTSLIQMDDAGLSEDINSGEDSGNFDHWISKLGPESEIKTSSYKKSEIIESFIQSEPGVIRADKETSIKGDISKNSSEENEGFITDTLARIYVKQGLYNKAIYAYEKLCLKYPEKSIYFASQIEEIKSLYNKK